MKGFDFENLGLVVLNKKQQKKKKKKKETGFVGLGFPLLGFQVVPPLMKLMPM